jgi:hypothetical protein
LFTSGQKGFQFDPSDFSTMRIARDGSGPAPQIGDVVGWIEDLSGNGHHAAARTDAGRPRLEMVAGKPALRFDGVDDLMSIEGVPVGSDLCVFAAAEVTGAGVLLGQNHSSLPRIGRLLWFGNSFSCRVYLADGSTQTLRTNIGSQFLGDLKVDDNAVALALRSGEAASVPLPQPFVNVTTRINIGDHFHYPSRPFSGALFGMIAYTNSLPSAAEGSAADSWITRRMGTGI